MKRTLSSRGVRLLLNLLAALVWSLLMTASVLLLAGHSLDGALETAQSYPLACILTALEEMVRAFPGQRGDCLRRYRESCVTLGRRVTFQRDNQDLTGTAADINDRFALVIRCGDGQILTLSSGTITML